MQTNFFGERGVIEGIMEKDVRIIASRTVDAMTESFASKTGLTVKQFAANSWGYPFIPIPFVQDRYKHLRMAPKNVGNDYLGHPIYWIKPSLTEMRPGETRHGWCIRMFYLIAGFGYWNEKLEFIDFLRVNDFSFMRGDIQAYHQISQDCATDKYRLLDEDSLIIPLEQVEENYQRAKDMSSRILMRENENMLRTQAEQYLLARDEFLTPTDTMRSWSKSYNEPGGLWERFFAPPLSRIAQQYDDRAETGEQKISDLAKKTERINDNLLMMVQKMNHAASIMEIPIKSAILTTSGGASRLSYIASAMSLANEKNNLRQTLFKEARSAIEEAFDHGNQGVGHFEPVIDAMSSIYSSAWNRLWLWFINYENYVNNDVLYSTLMEMKGALKAADTSSGNGSDARSLTDILGTIDFS